MAWPRTSRQSRGYGRQHELIREQLLREVILCEECSRYGLTTVGSVADRIVPLSKGGSGDRSNYQLLCRSCSNTKTARDSGRTLRKRRRIGLDGWPIEEE